MQIKPLYVLGIIMSFVYVFFGLLILTTNTLQEFISEHLYRIITGGLFLAYGLFRARYFIIQMRHKA